MAKKKQVELSEQQQPNIVEQQQDELIQSQEQEFPVETQIVEDVPKVEESSVIKIGDGVDAHKSANKFDIFWIKVWAAICSFIQSVSLLINKGIKLIFKKEAPIKYIKAVISIILIIIAVFIVSAPFNITVNEVEELEIYPNGLTVVQKQVGVDSATGQPIYKYGYANKQGKIKIDCIYDDAMSFKYKVAWVNTQKENADGYVENYWTLINTKGKQVGELKVMQNDRNVVPVSTFGDKYKLAPVMLGGKYGFVNTKGKLVIGCKYDEAGNFDYKLARVRLGSENYFINNKGKKVSETYTYARDFKEGIAAVSINNLWGFIDENGNPIGDLEYENVSDFKQGYALVKRGATYGIIDKRGNNVVITGVFTDLDLVEFFEMPNDN